ncbi:MAG: hypothetical protein ACFHXK_06370 [bacterium]
MTPSKSLPATVGYPLQPQQLARVTGGCGTCQAQLNPPSTLALFAPSHHVVHPGASQTADFSPPPEHVFVF